MVFLWRGRSAWTTRIRGWGQLYSTSQNSRSWVAEALVDWPRTRPCTSRGCTGERLYAMLAMLTVCAVRYGQLFSTACLVTRRHTIRDVPLVRTMVFLPARWGTWWRTSPPQGQHPPCPGLFRCWGYGPCIPADVRPQPAQVFGQGQNAEQ